MERVIDVAAFICAEFSSRFGKQIDEMKLHKLLYFVQRRSIADTNEPMFNATFHAWKYGPVLPEIRDLYKSGTLQSSETSLSGNSKQIIYAVMKDLAGSDSLLLSSISHGDLSWQRARDRMNRGEGDNMDINDIREDAMRYKRRREWLKGWHEFQNSSML